jgi:hypothetical protein
VAAALLRLLEAMLRSRDATALLLLLLLLLLLTNGTEDNVALSSGVGCGERGRSGRDLVKENKVLDSM